MEETAEKILCTNCSAVVTGQFCSFCGQKRFVQDDLTLRRFLNDAVKEFFSFDNRLFRSLIPLLLRPGELTLQYITGRQNRFIKPLSLFVFVNIFFFFVGYRAGLMNWKMEFAYGATGKAMLEERAMIEKLTLEEYVQPLNEDFRNYQRSLFFGVIPLFAIFVKVILFRKRRSIVEHIIYSIHYHSSYLILLPVTAFTIILIFGVVDKVFGTRLAIFFGNDPGIAYYAFSLMVMYHYLALRRIYGDHRVVAFLQSVALGVGSVLIMIPLGQWVLFWLVWFTAA